MCLFTFSSVSITQQKQKTWQKKFSNSLKNTERRRKEYKLDSFPCSCDLKCMTFTHVLVESCTVQKSSPFIVCCDFTWVFHSLLEELPRASSEIPQPCVWHALHLHLNWSPLSFSADVLSRLPAFPPVPPLCFAKSHAPTEKKNESMTSYYITLQRYKTPQKLTLLLRPLLKYFATWKEKFHISKQQCNLKARKGLFFRLIHERHHIIISRGKKKNNNNNKTWTWFALWICHFHQHWSGQFRKFRKRNSTFYKIKFVLSLKIWEKCNIRSYRWRVAALDFYNLPRFWLKNKLHWYKHHSWKIKFGKSIVTLESFQFSKWCIISWKNILVKVAELILIFSHFNF